MASGIPSPRYFSGFSRFFMALALVALALTMFAVGAEASTRHKKKAPEKENNKYAALVMDAQTGRILFQANPDKQLHPASLTKVMTLLMAFDALEDGRMSLRDRIGISRHAASMDPSKLGLDPGDTIRVEDAIYAIVTKSANDVAVAMAEALGGSEAGFARMMTARAHGIGMSRTNFVNASGLHNPGQISTARDMAILARYVIREYPSYYRYFSTKSYRYGDMVLRNHNRLMETYEGMDGMKTGYVGPSGFNLVASAVRDGHRLIGVVFGGKTAASRNTTMASLLDKGFSDLARGGASSVLVAESSDSGTSSRPIISRRDSASEYTNEETPSRVQASSLSVASVTAPLPARKPASVSEDVDKGEYLVSSVSVIKPTQKPVIRSDALALPAGAIGEGAAMGLGGSASAVEALSGEAQDISFNSGAEDFVSSVKSAAQRASGKRDDVSEVASSSSPAFRHRIGRSDPEGSWSIQIGAYASSTATARILRDALGRLPDELSSVRALVSPLKTGAGDMLYRARLSGYARNDAIRACRHFRDCLVIAPRSD